MKDEKRRALEAAGFRIGDAEDFLGLTEEERCLVELRVAVSRAVRRLRTASQLTQDQVAQKLKSTQSRVAKIEGAAADVSLDQMFRGLFAVGGSWYDVAGPKRPASRGTKRVASARLGSKAGGKIGEPIVAGAGGPSAKKGSRGRVAGGTKS